ncbi:hypothetical protein [Nostoc sp. 'Peltigera membranacea cyanobiont' 210A]|uniref:hypothetical protein n=1 Tax=Nostoc sp. 'Peltigera membranacea cyanobiont' 210A TaxID=2014529 RepID=UPI002695C1A3|nr:hypothetical protein [Nostoc sp. 'Peltigera membranacea cyanobiont' 210A]
MVVGPRYIPGTPMDGSGDTDQVPDASRITPPVVLEGTRSRHNINVTVKLMQVCQFRKCVLLPIN